MRRRNEDVVLQLQRGADREGEGDRLYNSISLQCMWCDELCEQERMIPETVEVFSGEFVCGLTSLNSFAAG